MSRVQRMVDQMDKEGFGNCTNTGACEVECPKGISLDNIARMNRDSSIAGHRRVIPGGSAGRNGASSG